MNTANGTRRWITAHAAAHYESYPGFAPDTAGRTVRCNLPVSASGGRIRLVLTEKFGSLPVIYGHICAAVGGRIQDFTFGGSREVTVPADGSPVYSDPAELQVKVGDELTLWLYTSGGHGSVTATHLDAAVSSPGDLYGKYFESQPSWDAVAFACVPLCGYARIEAETTDEQACVIAAFGDSITAMELWTDPLRRRIERLSPGVVLANLGIGGNRLLRDSGFAQQPGCCFYGKSGISRFERDCLDQPGIKAVIIALGINDLGAPGDDPMCNPPMSEFPSFEELRDGFVGLAARCRENGLAVIGATVTPLFGTDTFRPEVEELRWSINRWIRTGGEFDMVLDFDSAVGQGMGKGLRSDCDSGDHIHPNRAGGQLMADCVDVKALLGLLRQ